MLRTFPALHDCFVLAGPGMESALDLPRTMICCELYVKELFKLMGIKQVSDVSQAQDEM